MPLRSQWQLSAPHDQLLLFLTSLAMDCFVWYSSQEVQHITRYVFAGIAVLIILCFWRVQAKRKPYALNRQQHLEFFLFTVDILAIIGACAYGTLTRNGQDQNVAGRVAHELALGVSLAISVAVVLIFIAADVTRERWIVQQFYIRQNFYRKNTITPSMARPMEFLV